MYADRAKIIGLLPRLLRPVAALCVRHSIKLDELIEALKYTLIDIGREELAKETTPISATRLSAITGVHRKDVARLKDDAEPIAKSKNLVMKVIGRWEQDRRFKKGAQPKPLRVDGKNSAFVDLVHSVSADLNPYAVLFELERIGAVVRHGDTIRLVKHTHSTRKDFEEGLGQLADDLGDLVVAVEENLVNDEIVPNHHLSTEYDDIPPECAAKLRALLFEEGKRIHKKMRTLLSQFDRDGNATKSACSGRLRAVFGSYSCLIPFKEKLKERNKA